MSEQRETDLYPAIKSFLESQNYEVKSEVGAVDVVALRNDEPPVIVELKIGFSLALIHQGIARLSISDDVYLCVARGSGRRWLKSLKDNTKLCRRLGLGLITVRLKDDLVEVHCDPGPYAPRKSKQRQKLLLKEFAKRQGDPNKGGATRTGLVTAYRQDAQKLAHYLSTNGSSKGSTVAAATGVDKATRMMADNHYGWFVRVETGIYGLSPEGQAAAAQGFS